MVRTSRRSNLLNTCPSQVLVETNRTRYGKGEEAKHKMIDSEIELRAGVIL